MQTSATLPKSRRVLFDRGLALAAFCATLAGCGSVDPVAYSGLPSSAQLVSNPQSDGGRTPYRYGEAVDWRGYNRIIIEPVAIYRGPDNQFDDLSEADKEALAKYMKAQFAEKLGRRFALGNDAAPGTLRLKLTLTGATTNTPVLSTLSRFDIAGGLYNGVQSVRGREGALTGSVLYAAEIYDASSNRLLSAFITKQYPNAYNLPAGMGSLAAARTGIEKGAEELAAQMSR